MNGATTQADIWGIFGREGLDLANRWTTPATDSPTYLAMKMYRNYDGNGSAFGDTSVGASVANPDQVSAFASIRASDGALTVMVVNKNLYNPGNPRRRPRSRSTSATSPPAGIGPGVATGGDQPQQPEHRRHHAPVGRRDQRQQPHRHGADGERHAVRDPARVVGPNRPDQPERDGRLVDPDQPGLGRQQRQRDRLRRRAGDQQRLHGRADDEPPLGRTRPPSARRACPRARPTGSGYGRLAPVGPQPTRTSPVPRPSSLPCRSPTWSMWRVTPGVPSGS